MAGRVQGKVAIVTGGASGIGKASCVLLAREGAKVIVADLDRKNGEAVAKEIVEKGGTAIFVRQDVCSEADWQNVIKVAKDTYGGVDVLFNNAGILLMGSIEEATLDEWHKIHRVNSDGVFLGCKYGYAAMKERGGGSIINMSSVSGSGGSSSFVAYSATKGAVAAMTRSIAAHSRFHGINIRCNSIHPDGVRTPMIAPEKYADKQPQLRLNTPEQAMARLSEPEDVAQLVLFIASDESRRIQGSELRIDNGYLLWAD